MDIAKKKKRKSRENKCRASFYLTTDTQGALMALVSEHIYGENRSQVITHLINYFYTKTEGE